jgi:hypothetical protein
VRPWGDAWAPSRELLPYVDNVSMVDLARGYELAAGYDAPGRYAGIVLDHFNFGDLTSYLTGTPECAYWADRGVIARFARPFAPQALLRSVVAFDGELEATASQGGRP